MSGDGDGEGDREGKGDDEGDGLGEGDREGEGDGEGEGAGAGDFAVEEGSIGTCEYLVRNKVLYIPLFTVFATSVNPFLRLVKLLVVLSARYLKL